MSELDDWKEPTPEQQAAIDRIFMALEGQADRWAEEVNLPYFVNGAVRSKASADAIIRMAFEEGYYRGFEDAKKVAELLNGGPLPASPSVK